jgi:hypothetical protein
MYCYAYNGGRLDNEELHNFFSSLSPHIIRVIEMKENEMGRTCDMHQRDEECIRNFGRET